MTLDQFSASLSLSCLSAAWSPLLAALWWEAKGDWNRAHSIAQDEPGRYAAWVHAYLHRKEGDAGNAGYWYRQAGRLHCTQTLKQEWEQIATSLLAADSRLC